MKCRKTAWEWKRPLGRHWHRWEDNIKRILEETGSVSCSWLNKIRWVSRGTNHFDWRKMGNFLSNCQLMKNESAAWSCMFLWRCVRRVVNVFRVEDILGLPLCCRIMYIFFTLDLFMQGASELYASSKHCPATASCFRETPLMIFFKEQNIRVSYFGYIKPTIKSFLPIFL
jgi:hypothetical protein